MGLIQIIEIWTCKCRLTRPY